MDAMRFSSILLAGLPTIRGLRDEVLGNEHIQVRVHPTTVTNLDHVTEVGLVVLGKTSHHLKGDRSVPLDGTAARQLHYVLARVVHTSGVRDVIDRYGTTVHVSTNTLQVLRIQVGVAQAPAAKTTPVIQARSVVARTLVACMATMWTAIERLDQTGQGLHV
jgi:hypothetical protein